MTNRTISRTRPNRTLLTLLVSLLLAVFSMPAFAQDVSREGRTTKKDISATLDRTKDQSKALDKDKTKDKKDLGLSEGPADSKDVNVDKRTPEEIDKIKRELEAKNMQMIQKLDQIIQGDPYSAQKPDWMFQKAELLWELRNWEYLRARAEYNQCLGAADAGNIDESKCKEPVADYGDAQTIYSDILKQYPDYSRLDEVIYRLGRGLIEAGEGAKAVPLLQRLVQNYPNSRYKPEAHLALGEFYFDKNIFNLAKTNYEEVIGFESYGFREYARYKLGWVHYNQNDYRLAVDTFKQVVETNDQTIGFRNQALNDLILGFAQLEDGWKEARTYFLDYDKRYAGKDPQAKGDKEYAYKQMGKMAGYLEQQGQDEDAIEIYEWFIGERPNNKKIPEWMESIVIAKKKEVNNLEATEAAMNRFIAYLDPAGTWATQNKENKGAIQNAELLTEASLAYLSNVYHVRAEKEGAIDDYKKAADYYEQFVKRFPNKPASFDMNFLLGQIYLFELKELPKAAAQYQKVVDLYKADKIPKGIKKEDAEETVELAAFATVNAYNELVKSKCEDSILVKMAEAAESSKDGVYKTKDTMDLKEDKPNPKVDIAAKCKYELSFVEASDQWSEMYPKDKRTPTVDYVSAEIYKARGHYDKCVPRYENIIKNAPKKHPYRSFAGASLLDANYRLERWNEVEKWARYLLENKIFDVTPKTGLQQTIAFAINEKAKDLDEAKKPMEAASELLRLADEFPESDLAPGAVFNAAAYYERGEQINKAIETYERVVAMNPKDEKAKEKQIDRAAEALFVMGAIFESRADFDRAASYFERLADEKYRDHERASDAIYNAGVLREAMEQWDKAIEVYEKYIDLYGKTGDEEVTKNVRELGMRMAHLEKERENWKDALKRFESFTKRKDIKPNEVIEANAEIGLLHEKMKGKRWQKNADEAFDKVYKTYAEKFPAHLETVKDEKDKKAQDRLARKYVSEAKFTQAERIYDEFAGIKLTFPMSTLQKNLVKKGELEQKAEKIYFEVIDLKNPFFVSAAAYRVGSMYKNFSDELYNLPMPEGLTPDQEDLYRMQLDEYAFPLQEKALTAFKRARQLALDLEAYNEWSSKSCEVIAELEAQAYPITEQDGVETGHDQVLFTKTKPAVAVADARDRLKEREDARRAKEEEERKRKEAEEAAKKAAAEAAANGGAQPQPTK